MLSDSFAFQQAKTAHVGGYEASPWHIWGSNMKENVAWLVILFVVPKYDKRLLNYRLFTL